VARAIAPGGEDVPVRPAVSARRVARAAARPAAPAERHLELVHPEPSPAPSLARSRAEEIAATTGGTIESSGGTHTVHLPPPPMLSQAPVTISRELSEGGGGASSATAPVSGNAGGAMSQEAMYDYFIERFKRDLLIEREQLGHLIIDNP
jgi:hypothetical protein